jgi:O-antigen/teichoic acid export membrane protein
VDDYGKVSYETALASLAASATLLGLNTTVTKYLSNGSTKTNIQANQVILISGGISAVVVALVEWQLAFFVIGMTFWMMTVYELLGKKLYKEYLFVVVGLERHSWFYQLPFTIG